MYVYSVIKNSSRLNYTWYIIMYLFYFFFRRRRREQSGLRARLYDNRVFRRHAAPSSRRRGQRPSAVFFLLFFICVVFSGSCFFFSLSDYPKYLQSVLSMHDAYKKEIQTQISYLKTRARGNRSHINNAPIRISTACIFLPKDKLLKTTPLHYVRSDHILSDIAQNTIRDTSIHMDFRALI